MRRLLPALLAAVLLPAASASAAPIEGLWVVNGTAIVEFTATGANTYAGTVRVGMFTPCGDPGATVVPSLSGSGGTYSGTLRLSGAPCAAPSDTPATIDLTSATGGPGDFGTMCSPGQVCQSMYRSPAAQCVDGVDNDLDGGVDGSDPACQTVYQGLPPTSYSESADPRFTVATGTPGVREGRTGDRTRVTFNVRLSPALARTAAVTTTLVGAGADPASDLAVVDGVGRLVFGPRELSKDVTVDVLGDDRYEGPGTEAFGIALSDPDGGVIGTPSAMVSIFDDDFPPTSSPIQRPPSRTPATRPSSGGRGGGDVAACPLELTADVTRAADCPVLPKAVNMPRRRKSGSAGVDRIVGTPKADLLLGLGGNDTLIGVGASDRLNGGRGNDVHYGGGGNDEIDGGDGDDRLIGGPGNDLLVEERFGDDTLDGGPGNDLLRGDHGDDRIDAGPGDDIVIGGSGKDTVDCGPGKDVLYYNLVADRARSRNCEKFYEEEDIAQVHCPRQGTADGELVLGGSGRDTCHGNGGDDDVEGGGGSDRLFGGAGNDTMFGRFGRDFMDGGPGNDVIEGGRDHDTLYGRGGNDTLVGGYGRDRLYGGPGNDILNPGWGERGEVADCGPGLDTFIYGPGDRAVNCERTRRP
jgi:Ca2+-binding RTX toxin-like protein